MAEHNEHISLPLRLKEELKAVPAEQVTTVSQDEGLPATPSDPVGKTVTFADKHQPDDNHPHNDEDPKRPEGDHAVFVHDEADLPEGKKKKKKKRKPASKRGLGKPTGMEEFFADAPMTPEEYEENKSIYNSELPFLDRLLTSIQRFERTRKLTPERRDIFYKWLHYGGLKIAPNIGIGGQGTDDMEKGNAAAVLSQVSVPADIRDDLININSSSPKYVVDFMGCMRGFLSRSATNLFALDTKVDVDRITSTLERFLDYLLQHDVCPEYHDDILATRNFARGAKEDLWACAEASRWLPGDFNIACSTLFGGTYAQFDGKTYWGDMEKADGPVFVGQTKEEASEIFRFAIAGAASQDVFDKYSQMTHDAQESSSDLSLEIVDTIDGQGFEIIQIIQPTADCKDMYKNNSDRYRPVGRIIAKSWINPDAPPEDLSPEERLQLKDPTKVDNTKYQFFIEEIILQHLHVGQKVVAKIWKVNCGVWFFDEFTRIYPPFDYWCVNELMEDHKEPRWLNGAYAPGAPGWNLSKGAEATNGSDEQGTTAVQDIEANGDA